MFHGSNNQASHASHPGFVVGYAMYGKAAFALRQMEATYG
jgi:hypothetical protein